jgi:D-alanyl-lipoteichoic acid acyltransferase DltB (MBOAT superfamily)
MSPNFTLLAAAVYVLLGRWIVSQRGSWQHLAFAGLNILAVYSFFFYGRDSRYVMLLNLMFVVYLALISVQYFALRQWGRQSGRLGWLAFGIPIAMLAVIRYAPAEQFIHNVLHRKFQYTLGWVFTGFSYLAFRTSFLAIEVRDGIVPRPEFAEYLGFAFFAPTMSVGPISPYSQYREAFSETDRPLIPIGPALLRVLVGAVKYRFLGPLLNQLTYSGLLLDGHPHPWIDLPVAAVAYTLYLYCNFSGFCDIAIGGAGLMGVPVAENFQNPLAARNMQDFWNRWHITLSNYMRDVVFSPLSMMLGRIMGPANSNHAAALTIVIVFLLIGIWHGIGWNYAAFGAMHALGVAVTMYYTAFLKKLLGKKRYAAYERNPWIHAAAVALTFTYVNLTMFVFANDWTAMKTIFSMIHY